MQNLRTKSNPEDKTDVRWRYTLPTFLLLSQGVIACRNWRPHRAHIHPHLIEPKHSEVEESQIMFEVFKIWDCKIFPPKPRFVQVTGNLEYWLAFHRPSRGGVVEPWNDWRADSQETGNIRGSEDSSPLDTPAWTAPSPISPCPSHSHGLSLPKQEWGPAHQTLSLVGTSTQVHPPTEPPLPSLQSKGNMPALREHGFYGCMRAPPEQDGPSTLWSHWHHRTCGLAGRQ